MRLGSTGGVMMVGEGMVTRDVFTPILIRSQAVS